MSTDDRDPHHANRTSYATAAATAGRQTPSRSSNLNPAPPSNPPRWSRAPTAAWSAPSTSPPRSGSAPPGPPKAPPAASSNATAADQPAASTPSPATKILPTAAEPALCWHCADGRQVDVLSSSLHGGASRCPPPKPSRPRPNQSSTKPPPSPRPPPHQKRPLNKAERNRVESLLEDVSSLRAQTQGRQGTRRPDRPHRRPERPIRGSPGTAPSFGATFTKALRDAGWSPKERPSRHRPRVHRPRRHQGIDVAGCRRLEPA